MTTGNAIDDAWIEIASGIAIGETTVRWYVEYCSAGNRCIIADRRTEDEAILTALAWELPIVHSRNLAGIEARSGESK